MPLHQLSLRTRRVLYSVLTGLALLAAIPLINLTALQRRIEVDTTDSLGRQVRVGAVRFALLPSPSVTLEDVSMTEPDRRTPFLRWDSARFSLGWQALWHGRAELVDGRIQGLWLSVRSVGDGRLNIDDLLTRRPKSNRIDWRPTRLDLVGASLDWRGQDGRLNRLQNVTLHALDPESENGGVSLQGQVSAPDWGGGLRLDSGLHIDRSRLTAQLPGMRLSINAVSPEWQDGHFELTGDVAAAALPWRGVVTKTAARSAVKHGDQLWQLGFSTPQLNLDEHGLSTGRLDGELGIKSPSRELDGKWQIEKLAADQTGTLVADSARLHFQLLDDAQNAQLDVVSPLRLDGWQRLSLEGFVLTGGYRHKSLPRGLIKLELGGRAAVDLARERLDWDSRGTLDGSPLAAQLSLENFIDTRYAFGIDLGKLDLTPYLPVADHAALVDPGQSLGYGWLRDLAARGDVKIGELDLGRFRVFNIKTHLEAKEQRLALDPLTADIYGGTLDGRLALDTQKQPHISTVQSLRNMEVAALLSDAFSIDRLSGRGTINLDVNAPAGSFDAIRNGLSGRAELLLAHGALSGLDISDTLRGLGTNFAQMLGGEMKGDTNRRTQFSNFSARFQLKEGVAESRDLSFHTPFVSLSGGGKVDLAHNQIDTLLQATVLGGSGVPGLDTLKGTVVPIQISGALASPTYKVDTSGLRARLTSTVSAR
ncbi:MAG: AsmA family protein [Burkholderiales bacterium]|nr:AsmA family protein [Burkholderiales bacterium]